ncbi:RNA polymerase sigma factor [Cryptosporangium phraense]|uniref:RNA polymerase sigma factor n=1 Tax=Cryptosporangium phraense TaxID=2593070 RepID=A0A545ATW3_9ACTN|nr:RNA polymerase sigma factor [Cryptosporangium phraense]TQS44766.1 RNA polymerase sigma factor [Cryptosporangium phraense]
MAEAERFTALYREHSARVYAYAVSRGGRGLAEEVVAETFLVAWRRLDVVPAAGPGPGPGPVPWLLATARNVLRERFRDEVRQRSVAEELRAWVTGSAEDEVAERAGLLAALAALSEDDRELLTLVAWHGLSAADAARVVGCSTSTFFVRLHRARRRLEQAVRQADEPPAAPRSSLTEPPRAGLPPAEPSPVGSSPTGRSRTGPAAAGPSPSRPSPSRPSPAEPPSRPSTPSRTETRS